MDASPVAAQRAAVAFQSGSDRCAAWFYPGSSGACVVMATGAGITKEPGTDRFAARFQQAGHSVLAFDYRNFGASGGRRRQALKPASQVQDLRAALAYARTLPGVDPGKVAAWGFSLGGGHVLRAAGKAPVAAVVAQTPFVDGFAAAPHALRHEPLWVVLIFPLIALYDAIRAMLGLKPHLVPLAGPRGSIAVLTTPDAADGPRALDPHGEYTSWIQALAARSVMTLGTYRPGRHARRITVPLLLVVAQDDQSVLAQPALDLAARVETAHLLEIPGGHYAPFLDQYERVVTAELDFLEAALR